MFCNVSSAAITKIKGASFFIEVRDLWPFYILEKANEQNFFIRSVVFLLYPFSKFLFKFSLSAASIIYVPAEGYREKLLACCLTQILKFLESHLVKVIVKI